MADWRIRETYYARSSRIGRRYAASHDTPCDVSTNIIFPTSGIVESATHLTQCIPLLRQNVMLAKLRCSLQVPCD